MLLSDVRVDPLRIEEGAWVDNLPELPDFRVKVRGANNKDWKKLQTRLLQSIPRHKRIAGQFDPEEIDRINAILLLETSLLDWSGLTMAVGGEPIPYTKEMAKTLLTDPQWGRVRDGILWAAQVVGEQVEAEIKEKAKN